MMTLTTSRVCGRKGFTLVEAMVALSITAMAGAVLLLASESALETTTDAVDETIAQGIVAQLIDEVLGARYCEVASNPYETTLGPSTWERNGAGRERYNDTDDYHRFDAQPPQDAFGIPLGQEDGYGGLRHPALRSPGNRFQNWREEIAVSYVDPNNPRQKRPSTQPSDYRMVSVTIKRIEPNGAARYLAEQRRVFCYVPIP